MFVFIAFRLTFLILVIESHLTGNNRTTEPEQLNLTSSNCWLQENFEIIEQCQPCSGNKKKLYSYMLNIISVRNNFKYVSRFRN